MKVSEQKKGKATVFSLEGRLDSNTSPDVEKKISDTIHKGEKEVVLDFSALEYISSAGIRVLVHCSKEVEKLHGHIYLAAVPKPIEHVLYLTGFLPYFVIYENSNQAIEALSKIEKNKHDL